MTTNFSNPATIRPEAVLANLSRLAQDIKPPNLNRAAIYIRKSRVLQNSPSYSPEIQERECRAVAERSNLQIVTVISDLDKSGKNSNRPGLQELLNLIKKGEVDYVIVHFIDRQYRNGLSMLKFFERIQEHNVALISVNEQIDTRTAGGRLMLFMMAAVAEMPIFTTSIRTRQAAKRRKERGFHHGGYRLGYCNGMCSTCTDPNGKGYCPLFGGLDRPESDHGRIQVPHPIEKHAVQLIASLYHQGWSLREIAKYLNDNEFDISECAGGMKIKFRTKGVPGSVEPGAFSPDSVLDIVRNVFYAGYVAHYPTSPLSMKDDLDDPTKYRQTVKNRRQIEYSYPGKHEPLISYELWQENQSIRKSKKQTPTNAGKSARVFPLSGIAQCWECLPFTRPGRTVSLRGNTNGSNQRVYRCAGLHGRQRDRDNRIDLTSTGLISYPDRNVDSLRERHILPSLPAEKLETQIDELLAQLILPEQWYERIVAYALSDAGMGLYASKRHNLEMEMAKFIEQHSIGAIDSAELKNHQLRIAAELSRLTPKTHPFTLETTLILKDFSQLWHRMLPREQRALLGIIFDRIYFDGKGQLQEARIHSPFDELLK